MLLAAETARERWGEELAEADLEVSVEQPAGRMPRPSRHDLRRDPAEPRRGARAATDAGAVTDPAALITDPALAAEVRHAQPDLARARAAARRRGDRADGPRRVHQPGRDPAHRGADRGRRGEAAVPFRYREGIADPGQRRDPAAALRARPARLAGTQAAVAALTRAQPASAGAAPPDRLRARAPRPPASARRAIGSRSGPGGMSSTPAPPVGTTSASTVDADGHPGYLATARMLGEAGLLLAENGATPDRAGCLTPATALGTDCIDRFELAGLRFSVAVMIEAPDTGTTRRSAGLRRVG